MVRPVVLAALLVASALVPSTGYAANPVAVGASFERGAHLGGTSALNVAMHVDTSRERSPIVGVRLAYADGLGLVLSGLGLASCAPPPSVFEAVLSTESGLGGCPANSVMAYGTLRADVRLIQTGQVIREYATVVVLSGPIADGTLRLVVYVDGQRPFGGRFVLAGETADARPPYGGALNVSFPGVPGLDEIATIGIADLRLSIGSPRIRYYAHGRTYHPQGLALPPICPHGGFRFAVALRFKDKTGARAQTAIPCRALAAPR